ncbi:MAG: hypothetical protein J4F32_02270 [Dehalococcoidia bacterium]|nr:hypothetical protein [Dehalococcoidia bacterium]
MAKLSETPGRPFKKGGAAAYVRCFGNEELSMLLSRVQSLIIRSGLELENLITKELESSLIQDLDEFLSDQIMQPGVKVATKKVIKVAKRVVGNNIEPDFMVFERTRTAQQCYVIELKDGHEFDTKSSAKEHTNLVEFLAINADVLKYYQRHSKICGFNANTREEIQQGFKGMIGTEEAMTGREFCDLLRIDYQAIVDIRANDRQENLDYLVEHLLNIEAIQSRVNRKLKS